MSKVQELGGKAKKVYRVKFGCLSIASREDAGEQTTVKEVQERLCRLFISDDLVSEVHKGSDSPTVSKLVVGKGIGTRPRLGTEKEVIRLGDPIRIHLRYPLAKIDNDYCQLHKVSYEMNTILLYDGFLYLFGIQEVGGIFNYQRHGARLHKWLSDLISKDESWITTPVPPSPLFGAVRLYLLEQSGRDVEEREWLINHEYSEGLTVGVSYVCGEQSVAEAIDDAMYSLYSDTDDKYKRFYLCQLLNSIIRSENYKAENAVGQVIQESLDFYDIHFLNLWGRFHRCRKLGRRLLQLYASMPLIEKLQHEYSETQKEFETVGEEKLERSLVAIIRQFLPEPQQVVFTRSVNEMLRQNISEIRAQINYQVLLFSALITFLAIIVAATL